MSFRLRNQNSPEKTLSITSPAWFGILDIAEQFGWNPMGTVLPEWWLGGELVQFGYDLHERAGYRRPEDWPTDPWPTAWPAADLTGEGGAGDGDDGDPYPTNGNGHTRLVLLEDALNLADALERAFMAYEPRRTHHLADYFAPGLESPAGRTRPGAGAYAGIGAVGIGAIVAVTDFARLGAFSIEKHSRE